MSRLMVPAALRQFTDGVNAVTLAHPDGASLSHVLDLLGERFPFLNRRIRDEQGQLRRFVNVYVNGEDARRLDGLDTPVPESAEVLIVPSVAGG